MLRLFGIRPNRVFIALIGAAVLVIGLVMHGNGLTALGAVLIVYSAAALIVGQRRGAG